MTIIHQLVFLSDIAQQILLHLIYKWNTYKGHLGQWIASQSWEGIIDKRLGLRRLRYSNPDTMKKRQTKLCVCWTLGR